MTFHKGHLVVKVINVRASRSATIERINKVTVSTVMLDGSELKYDRGTGFEIDAPMRSMGIDSSIVPFDDGEVERWALDAERAP